MIVRFAWCIVRSTGLDSPMLAGAPMPGRLGAARRDGGKDQTVVIETGQMLPVLAAVTVTACTPVLPVCQPEPSP
jgi:hypothetical protein